MDERNCLLCTEPFNPRTKRSRFCSDRCNKRYYRDRPGTECSESDCTRPVRAKGKCGGCYNRIFKPDRHVTRITCVACGTPHVTRRAGGKFCSLFCYTYDRWGPRSCTVHLGTCDYCAADYALQSPLEGHCSWACLDAASAEARTLKQQARAVRVEECVACGIDFTTRLRRQAHCSRRCLRKMIRIRRRVAEAGSYGEYRWSDFARIMAKFEYRCAYCDQPPPKGERLEPDHVVPVSKGGPNTVANLLPSCRLCNGSKRDLSLEEWADFRVHNLDPPVRTTWSLDDPRYFHLTSVRPGDQAA